MKAIAVIQVVVTILVVAAFMYLVHSIALVVSVGLHNLSQGVL